METIQDGGPAFPTFHQNPMNGYPIGEMSGMTLRDYFAAKAMQGLASKEGRTDVDFEVQLAYRYADAMLKARRA